MFFGLTAQTEVKSVPQPPPPYTSCDPVEHCNSPEPNGEAPDFNPKVSKDKSKEVSVAKEMRQYVNSISDLGVNTEELPKPQMKKRKECNEKESEKTSSESIKEKDSSPSNKRGPESNTREPESNKRGPDVLKLDESLA